MNGLRCIYFVTVNDKITSKFITNLLHNLLQINEKCSKSRRKKFTLVFILIPKNLHRHHLLEARHELIGNFHQALFTPKKDEARGNKNLSA